MRVEAIVTFIKAFMSVVRLTSRAIAIASLLFVPLSVYTRALVAQSVLRPIDSIVVKETDKFMLSKLGSMIISPSGQIFLSDPGEGRVFQIAPNGTIVGTLGRYGNGPGEMTAAAYTTLIGDSLFVISPNQKRILVFSIGTRKFVRSFNTTLPSSLKLTSFGNQLVGLMVDPKTFAPVTLLSPMGVATSVEGVLPDFVSKNPKLAELPAQFSIAIKGGDVWGASSFSQSLYRWKRGTTTLLEELPLHVTRRRGVDPDKYMLMLRDRVRGAPLLFDFSFPLILQFITPDILALVSSDPTVKSKNISGTHYLTLIDVKAKKMCGDIQLPIPTDPMPRVVLTSDTLVVLQQDETISVTMMNSIRRFKIDPRQCAWKPL